MERAVKAGSHVIPGAGTDLRQGPQKEGGCWGGLVCFESECSCHESLQDGEERKSREDLGSPLMEEKEHRTRRVLDEMGSISGAH